MTNEERVRKFKSHKLVINCRTEEEAKKFVKWCFENGVKWLTSSVITTRWSCCDTCYRCYEDGCLVNSIISSYSEYEIITYKDFFKDEEQTNLKYMIDNYESIKNIDMRLICETIYNIKNGNKCHNDCEKCEFCEVIDCLKYLQEKHTETIKVSQFEYDLINSFSNATASNATANTMLIYSFDIFKNMKQKGYFNNVPNITIGEIIKRMVVEE